MKKKKRSNPMCGKPFESAHYFVTIRLKVDENKIGNITNEVKYIDLSLTYLALTNNLK